MQEWANGIMFDVSIEVMWILDLLLVFIETTYIISEEATESVL